MISKIKKLTFCLLFILSINSIASESIKQVAKPILIRPFGDSITYGLGFSDWGSCYFSQINQWLCMPPSQVGGGYRGWLTVLATQNTGIYFTTEGYQSGGSFYLQWMTNTQTHDGYPGFRTDQLIPFSTYASFSNFTLIHAGTNDILQNISIQTAVNNLFTIVNNLLTMNNNTTLMLAKIIPVSPAYKSYVSVNSNISAYNNLIQTTWAQLPSNIQSRVKIVDMSNILNPQTDYFTDGVHPNYNGYLKIACNWIDAINGSSAGGACSGLKIEDLKRKMSPSNFDQNIILPPREQLDKLNKGKI